MDTGSPQLTALGLEAGGAQRIARDRLVSALDAGRSRRLVLLDAPAGYGKTCLLAEWSATSRRRFVRLALGGEDGVPERLLTRLSVAVGASPFAAGRWDTRRATSIGTLLDEMERLDRPLVIVLDDYQRVHDHRAHEFLGHLVSRLPATVQLAIATRSTPPLPLARLRAGGDLLELRAADLRLDDVEAGALLAASGVNVADRAALGELLTRLEGWPAGVALAAAALRGRPDTTGAAAGFTGTHRDVADYLTEEVLQHQPPSLRAFLVRTSVLTRLSGPLCDAVLDVSGSQSVLERLERSNAFVFPLDSERRWYRYHHLFAEALRAELCAGPPAVAAELHRRASTWFDAAGAQASAAEHALAALRLDPTRRRPSDGSGVGRIPAGTLAASSLVTRRLEFGQRLTQREATILRLLATQLSKREIANELFVSVNTVKTHSRAIYRKLGVSSRQEAADRARDLHLLGPGYGAASTGQDDVLAS